MTNRSRRSVLGLAATLSAGGLAGCLDSLGGGSPGGETDATDGPSANDDAGADGATDGGTTANGERGLPTRETPLVVSDSMERLRENVVGGGPGKDGIPSIDDPQFEPASEVGDRLLPNEPVFGLEVDGEAKAYPQYVLVWHEIANDVVGDVPVAVTYCPLTGTVTAFERGPVEFGVSGKLVNSNLVMYDRETDSRWPQVLGTAIEGEFRGQSLEEHSLTWTSWKHWKDAHPEGVALTEDTGSVRDYGRDPYGTYNPKRGYYSSDSFLFSPIRRSDALPPKDVVHGVRTSDGAFAASESVLASERVVAGAAGSTDVVLVYDPGLEAGVGYANPDGVSVEPEGEQYRVDGETKPASDLGLERLPSMDAMFFAWYAFYPDGELVATADDAGGPSGLAPAREEVRSP